MGIATAIAVGAGVSAIGGAVASNQAKQAAKGARGAQDRAQQKIESLRRSRPTPINPYSSTKDLSEMAQDLSGQLTNAFSNLGVATQAAEIQMEQTDIALANTLDTLRATGASAGGATALAQAALQSKKGIAASIESQEAQNEKLRAQGEQQLQQQKISEQQRLQSIAIAEGRRVQAADAAGRQFEFQTKESRINADLDRASGQERQAAANAASANQAQASAISGAFGGVTSMIGSAAGGGAFG
jgi:methylthioribose-1-phosphate isomerase